MGLFLFYINVDWALLRQRTLVTPGAQREREREVARRSTKSVIIIIIIGRVLLLSCFVSVYNEPHAHLNAANNYKAVCT